jgi:hypothetical protein
VEKKLKFVRMAALLGAVSGASVFLALGSTAASAGEQRLHGEFTATYGLIPLTERSSNDSVTSPKSTKAATASVSRSKKGNSQPDEPKIEDPPLPGYDGANSANVQSMNSATGKSRGKSGNNG